MGNNRPIGEFQPQGFNPPWLPSMFYAKFGAEGELEFRWDYLGLADEWSGGTSSYYEEATKLSLSLPGDIPTPEIGGPIDRRIRALLGVAPLSPAIPIACEMGNPWILGGRMDDRGRFLADPTIPVDTTLRDLLNQGAGMGGKEAIASIRAQLAKLREANAVEMVPTVPQKAPVVEKIRTINDYDASELAALEITWPQFLAAAKARGRMTMAEISVAWAEHKANMKDMQKDAA